MVLGPRPSPVAAPPAVAFDELCHAAVQTHVDPRFLRCSHEMDVQRQTADAQQRDRDVARMQARRTGEVGVLEFHVRVPDRRRAAGEDGVQHAELLHDLDAAQLEHVRRQRVAREPGLVDDADRKARALETFALNPDRVRGRGAE